MTAVGTLTTSVTKAAGTGNILKYDFGWTSNSAGAVSGSTLELISGTIVNVEFIPSSDAQPDDNYDVSLIDEHGVNVLDDGTGTSIGANLSNTDAVQKVSFVQGTASGSTYVRAWLHGGDYELRVTNAGDTKSGTMTVYITPTIVL